MRILCIVLRSVYMVYTEKIVLAVSIATCDSACFSIFRRLCTLCILCILRMLRILCMFRSMLCNV